MKKATYILFVCLFVSTGLAYTYEVYTYGPSKNLIGNESILFSDEGGMDSLYLTDSCIARVEGTSALEEFFGGIWLISLAGTGHLDFLGGEVHQLDMNSYATATLKGGRIDEIWTYQGTGYPYIDLYCRSWNYNTTTKMLTGIWNTDNNNDGQWDPFSIELVDVQDYTPTFDNINIIEIPEPMTILLLGFGSLLIRKK